MKKLIPMMVIAMVSNVHAIDFVKFDKGSVNIQLDISGKPYDLKYKKTPECQADIIVKESGSTLQVTHSTGYCPSGTTFTLTINPLLVGSVTVDAGVISVLNTDLLLNEQINIKGYVDTGVVVCDKEVFSHRIVNYAGQEAVKNFGSEKNFLVHLTAGVLHL